MRLNTNITKSTKNLHRTLTKSTMPKKGSVCKSLYDEVVAENKRLKDALNGSAVEEDENGFAVSDWFHEHMAKHIKFHLTEIGGEYNYIDTETGEHVFEFGSGGTLDEAREYVGELKDENKLLTVAHTKTLKRRNWDQSERDKLRKEIESLKKSNKQKTKIIHRFKKQVKELEEELEEADDVPNTHGVSIIYEDGEEEEELFWYGALAEKYYYECVAKHKGSKTKIYLYSVPEEYDGGCESFKDAWLIRGCENPE